MADELVQLKAVMMVATLGLQPAVWKAEMMAEMMGNLKVGLLDQQRVGKLDLMTAWKLE